MNKTEKNIYTVYIGFGSNVGDRLTNIQNSLKLIEGHPGCKIYKISSVYESKAFGNLNQDNFYNMVAKVKTNLDPPQLFKFLKDIEKKIGRVKREKWGPREIDLDILLYDDLVFSEPGLTIPHKGILERYFVLIPLLEIEPEIIHPVLNKYLSDFSWKTEKNIIRKLSSDKKEFRAVH